MKRRLSLTRPPRSVPLRAAAQLGGTALMLLAWLMAAGCERPVEITREYRLALADGARVGYTIETRAIYRDRAETTYEWVMSVRRDGAVVRMENVTEHIETLDGWPVRFRDVTRVNGNTRRDVRGTISNGQLELRVTDDSGSIAKTIPWPRDAVLAEGARLLLRQTDLAEGATFSYAAFRPRRLSFETVTATVGAPETVRLPDGPATLTPVTFDSGELVSVAYVDADFHTLKRVSTHGGTRIEFVACGEQAALAPVEPIDVLAIGAVACPARLDSHTRARPLTYRLRPTGTDELNIPTDSRQTVARADNGSVLVTIAPIVQPIGRPLDYRGDDPVALAALAPSVYVQCDDERIVSLARRTIGDIDDAHEAARRLEAFVHTYVTDDELRDFDSAAAVYETRRGDCTEYAVLLAAMCRAVGVPAQIVTGLAYVDTGQDETPRFISHAWVRVYIGERWMHLDSTSRYVDGGYIMLTAGNGDADELLRSAKALGRFEIVQIITPDIVYDAAATTP